MVFRPKYLSIYTSPISNIIVKISDGDFLNQYLTFFNQLQLHLKTLFFIQRDLIFNLHLDFSETNSIFCTEEFLSCIEKYLSCSIFNKINFILPFSVIEKIGLKFSDSKIGISVLTKYENCMAKNFLANEDNTHIDLKIKLEKNYNLTAIYQLLQHNFNSIDFVLPTEECLTTFVDELLKLSTFYFKSISQSSIICLDNLIKNYFSGKINSSLALKSPSLLILSNGEIFKSENFLHSQLGQQFTEKWNIYRHRLLELILTNEYYEYHQTSSITKLDIESIYAIDEFFFLSHEHAINLHDDFEFKKLYKHPLTYFYFKSQHILDDITEYN
jgi:hypothetical protein